MVYPHSYRVCIIKKVVLDTRGDFVFDGWWVTASKEMHEEWDADAADVSKRNTRWCGSWMEKSISGIGKSLINAPWVWGPWFEEDVADALNASWWILHSFRVSFHSILDEESSDQSWDHLGKMASIKDVGRRTQSEGVGRRRQDSQIHSSLLRSLPRCNVPSHVFSYYINITISLWGRLISV